MAENHKQINQCELPFQIHSRSKKQVKHDHSTHDLRKQHAQNVHLGHGKTIKCTLHNPDSSLIHFKW